MSKTGQEINPNDPFILTVTGGAIDLIEPKPEQINIIDIAWALSMIPRFGGQSHTHYSVADHSLRVMHEVESHQDNPARALLLSALLHDATEAYLGDMVRPLKLCIPRYKEIEAYMERVICARFECSAPHFWPEIKLADSILLKTERRDLMPKHETPWVFLDHLPMLETIYPLTQEQAFVDFLTEFVLLNDNRVAPDVLRAIASRSPISQK